MTEVDFDVAGLHFALRLVPAATTIFAKDVVLEVISHGERRALMLNVSQFHVGSVVGDPGSVVQAHIDYNGNMEAVLFVHGRQYHVHPTYKYENLAQTLKMQAAHVFFEASQITSPHLRHVGGMATCGAHSRLQPLMDERMARSGGSSQPSPLLPNLQRERRQLSACKHCTCPVVLVADHFAFAGPHCQSDVSTCAIYMVNTLRQADAIYRATVFEEQGSGLGFSIKKITVYKDAGPENPVPEASYTPEAYLDAFSRNVSSSNFPTPGAVFYFFS